MGPLGCTSIPELVRSTILWPTAGLTTGAEGQLAQVAACSAATAGLEETDLTPWRDGRQQNTQTAGGYAWVRWDDLETACEGGMTYD